VINLSKV